MDKDMNTMPIPDLVKALRDKAGSTNDIVLALTLTVIANRLGSAYKDGVNDAIAALEDAGKKIDISTPYGEGVCDALCINAPNILNGLKNGA